MKNILMHLSLKYSGDWLTMYNSLQKREIIKSDDLMKSINQVDSDYITLIEDKYCENLKSIYKPPFGIYSYGKYEMINQNIMTVFCNPLDEKNNQFLEFLRNNNFNVLWVEPSNKELMHILTAYPTRNIFWYPEIKNDSNKTYRNVISDETIKLGNLFISELWEKDPTHDYSSQNDERVFLGVSHKCLILDKPKAKQWQSLIEYCVNENIKIFIHNSLVNELVMKDLRKCNYTVISNLTDFKFDEETLVNN